MKMEVFEYDGGAPVSFRDENGVLMVNATEMAKAFGKVPHEFLRLDQTKVFIAALESRLNVTGQSDTGKSLIIENQVVTKGPISVVKTVKGNYSDGLSQGTWLHERLALKFAAWLSVDFELWVWGKVTELLRKGVVEVTDGVRKEKFLVLEEVRDEVAVLESALALMLKQQEVLRGYQSLIDDFVSGRLGVRGEGREPQTTPFGVDCDRVI